MTRRERWRNVAKRIRGQKGKDDSERAGLCAALFLVFPDSGGKHWNTFWEAEADLNRMRPRSKYAQQFGRWRGYWWPLTDEGDLERLKVCRKLEAGKRKVKA